MQGLVSKLKGVGLGDSGVGFGVWVCGLQFRVQGSEFGVEC